MDREKRKAYMKAYYRKNRDRLLAEQKERDARAKAANPEQVREYSKAYREANRDRLLPAQRERARANYQANKERYRERNRRARFAKYGLTPEQFQDLLDAQGGGCAICTASPRLRRMTVDHCHRTGEVRGILCHPCNSALGLFEDNPDRLREAAEYLDRSLSGATSTTSSEPSSEP